MDCLPFKKSGSCLLGKIYDDTRFYPDAYFSAERLAVLKKRRLLHPDEFARISTAARMPTRWPT